MFHRPRAALRSGLATALALGAIAAPGALAQPLDVRPDARGASPSVRPAQDLRSPDARDAAEGRTIVVASSPSGLETPHPITRPHAVVDAPTSGLDWGSAGIGAAAVAGAFAIASAGIVGLRRRRIARIASLTSH
jgi:hypothetical protein